MLLSKPAAAFWADEAMLLTLAIHGLREKGKVGTGTFFTTIVMFDEPNASTPRANSDFGC